MSVAFRDPLPNLAAPVSPMNTNEQRVRSELETSIHETIRLRSNAVIWGAFWLLHYPAAFGEKWENWRTSAQSAAGKFMFDLAVYFGQDPHGHLKALSEKGISGLKALAALYEWVATVVSEPDPNAYEDGMVYSVGPDDHAQRLRDSLLPLISSAKSQAAYLVLNDLRKKNSGARAKYIRHLQFQMREEEAYVVPVAQLDYNEFERDFAPPVTGFTAFAQAVHNDLLAVKRDIEYGEFSLRRMFNLVVMKHIKTDTEGLALEEDFQALLGSELNHASGCRYVVTLEPTLSAGTRRDVLCQAGKFRATVELKMSERWTVAQYLMALEQQLKGQYMQAADSKIGFFVVVLQRNRKWRTPEGERVNFAGLINLLEAKALKLKSTDPALVLHIVGINAAPLADFRESRVESRPEDRRNGPAKYADAHGAYSGERDRSFRRNVTACA